jgi:mono/diheme cytochrome c family protein
MGNRITAWFRQISVLFLALMAAAPVAPTNAADRQVERGRYLVDIGGCTDCHTPGHFLGRPDLAKYLGGSDVGFGMPGQGVFVGPNLTPDKETGLGTWTAQQIATAITTGARPDGRLLAPVMPWKGYSHLTKSDALAIATFLKSLHPVSNKVSGPFGPDDKPTVFVMSPQPPEIYVSLPRPK